MKSHLHHSLFAVTLSFGALAGCGDSSGAGGAGGAATTTSASGATTATQSSSTTSSKSSTGATTSTTTGTTSATSSTSTGGQNCGSLSTKSDCRNCCGTQNPAGTTKLIHDVTTSCGCAANVTCSTQCAGEAFCTDGTSPLGTACNTCVGSLQGTEPCAMTGLATCQQDVECAAAENCQLSCLALP